MALAYIVDEVSVENATGFLYAVVRFWATAAARDRADAPLVTNDFRIQARTAALQPVSGAGGTWVRKDDVLVLPQEVRPADLEVGFKTEVVTLDVEQQLRDAINAFAGRAELSPTLRGDLTMRQIRRGQDPGADRRGLLRRPEMTGAEGRRGQS